MKKIIGLAVAMAFVLSSALVLAQAQAPANTDAEKAAKEECLKKNPNLTGPALDECVKTELKKKEGEKK